MSSSSAAWTDLANRCPVGLGRSEGIVLSQEMVDTHAATTGDAQWIHNDPERASAGSPFGGPIVQGFLLLSTLTRLSGDLTFPDVGPVAMMVNYGFDRVRFVGAVPVGSTVRLDATLTGVRPRDDGSAVLSVDVELLVDPGRVALVARWLFLAIPA